MCVCVCVCEESKRNDGLGLDTPRLSYFTVAAALEATGVPVLLVFPKAGAEALQIHELPERHRSPKSTSKLSCSVTPAVFPQGPGNRQVHTESTSFTAGLRCAAPALVSLSVETTQPLRHVQGRLCVVVR